MTNMTLLRIRPHDGAQWRRHRREICAHLELA